MQDLNLPIFKEMRARHKQLSMEEYIKFIDLLSKYVIDRKAIRKQKELQAVNVPFSLGDKK